MKTRLLYTLYLLCPLASPAADIHKLTPIAINKGIRVEISLSVEANKHLSFDTVISHTRNGEILCNRSEEFSFKDRIGTTIVWKMDGLNPKLWNPVTPVLYDLEIKTDTEVVHKQIGFRKFEMQDGVFYLNGKPIYLQSDAISPPERGTLGSSERSKEFVCGCARFMKDLNINIIRTPDDQDWMDVCDEEGMMILAGRYGRPKHGTNTAPPINFDLSFKIHKEIDLGPSTPCPSAVVHILANEMPSEGEVGTRYREFLTKICGKPKKWDDTRLYIGNTGYGLGKSGDVYDVHRHWGWYHSTFLAYLSMHDKSMWQNSSRV